MFLNVFTCTIVLSSTPILSVSAAALRVENFKSDVALSSLALANTKLAMRRHKESTTRNLLSSAALQAANLDGYLISQYYADTNCTDTIIAWSRELNYCMDISYGTDMALYQFTTATATNANTTYYEDAACTVRPSQFPKPQRYRLSTEECRIDAGADKNYYSISGDVATTRAFIRQT